MIIGIYFGMMFCHNNNKILSLNILRNFIDNIYFNDNIYYLFLLFIMSFNVFI